MPSKRNIFNTSFASSSTYVIHESCFNKNKIFFHQINKQSKKNTVMLFRTRIGNNTIYEEKKKIYKWNTFEWDKLGHFVISKYTHTILQEDQHAQKNFF